MPKPTTTNPHYAALTAQLAVLCDRYLTALAEATVISSDDDDPAGSADDGTDRSLDLWRPSTWTS